MQYRPFGKLDWKGSALGFGCMRLPSADGQRASPDVDEAEAIRMLRHAIDHGVNYVDTAYPYHEGKSELVVGRALRDGYREKVRLATKLPVWIVQGPQDFDRFLNEQLAKLQTDHIDFYLLHGLNKASWTNVVLKHGLLGLAERALADGRIRHLGFSFHDDYACFEEIVNGSDLWTFCQIQYNYMDMEDQAGTRGLKLAAEKGLAVVIMEPLMGGRLADPPPAIRETIAGDPAHRSPAQLAFEWLWDQPEVSVVLSGMSAMSQVVENLRLCRFGARGQARPGRSGAHCAGPRAIPGAHRDSVHQMRLLHALPQRRQHSGQLRTLQLCQRIRRRWLGKVPLQLYAQGRRARRRLHSCDTCEGLCPQHIAISDWMPKVSELLGS